MPGDTAAEHLGAAAWIGHEGADATFMWPHMFARVADEYDRGTASTTATCARSRSSTSPTPGRTRTRRPATGRCPTCVPARRDADDDEVNPVIEGRMRRFDCSQMTDGGAGVVLVTDDYLRDHPDARPIGRIDGWGHRTVGLGLQQKLDRSADEPVRAAARARRGARRVRPRRRHPRRRRRLRGARLLHPERVPRHRPHRAHRARRVVEGHRERRDRDRRPRCRSTPAAA